MNLLLDNNREICFAQNTNRETNGHLEEWWGGCKKGQLDIKIGFGTAIFKNQQDEHSQIDWSGIQFVVSRIVAEIDTLVDKSVNVLLALHKEIFGNEFREKHGYFELSYVEIKSFSRSELFKGSIDYVFELAFYLGSKTDEVMDPYFQYLSRFESIQHGPITLCGVSRQ